MKLYKHKITRIFNELCLILSFMYTKVYNTKINELTGVYLPEVNHPQPQQG